MNTSANTIPTGVFSLNQDSPPKDESPVAKALREELKRHLEQPLTVSTLRRLGRTITASIKVLQATADGVEALLPAARRGGPNMGAFGLGGGMYPINGGASPDPDEVDVGEEPQGPQGGMGNYAFAGAPPLETFGTSTFREIAAMFMKYLDQKSSEKNAPRVNDIVRSIAQAKLAGLDDVADRLKLTLNQALEQQEKKADESRTISPDSVVVTESPLPSTPPAAIIGL